MAHYADSDKWPCPEYPIDPKEFAAYYWGKFEVIDMKYIIAGNRLIAERWARKNKVPRSNWRYVFEARDIRGLFRDQVLFVEPFWLDDSPRDNRRKIDIIETLDSLPRRTG